MTCTYEEAKVRYPKGTKFVVITPGQLFNLCPTDQRCLKKGDIIELSKISRCGHYWYAHYQLDPKVYNSGFVNEDHIYCDYIEELEGSNVAEVPKICTCNLWVGCRCGVFEEEMRRSSNAVSGENHND